MTIETVEGKATESSAAPLKKKVTLKSKKVGYNPDEQEELDEIKPLSAPRSPRLSVDKTGENKKVSLLQPDLIRSEDCSNIYVYILDKYATIFPAYDRDPEM